MKGFRGLAMTSLVGMTLLLVTTPWAGPKLNGWDYTMILSGAAAAGLAGAYLNPVPASLTGVAVAVLVEADRRLLASLRTRGGERPEYTATVP